MAGKQCDRCGQPFKGFGTTCAKCRKLGKNPGIARDCDKCGNFFVGHGAICPECTAGKGFGRTGVRTPTADEVDEVLDKIGISIRRVDISQGSMVKLRKAEINILGELEVIRDLMDRIYRSGDRQLLRSTFVDCGRMARLTAFLSQVHFSEMNAKDQRFAACQHTCSLLKEKVAEELDIGDQLTEATDAAESTLLLARISIVMDEQKVAELQVPLEIGDGEVHDMDDTDPYEDDFESESDEEEEQLTEEQEDDRFKSKVRALFDELDRNGDGQLTREEVKNAAFGLSAMLKECRIHKRSHVMKMFKHGDLDKDGTLDYDEFLAYILAARQHALDAMPKTIDDQMVRMVFMTMDKDGDGTITCEELKWAYAGILLRAGEPIDPKRVAKWAKRNFKKYDTDNSSALDIDEFKDLLQHSGALKPLLATVSGLCR